jgi:hypothetical protein
MTETAEAAAGGDALTPAEQAYFESGGTRTDGLVPEETAGNDVAASTEAAQAAPSEDENASPPQGEADDPALGPDGKPKNPGQWVRHGALHAERERRKKAEAELQAERELRARFDERLKMYDALQQPNAARAEEPPDPNNDIFGYVRYLERKVADVEGKISETARLSESQRADMALKDAYFTDARNFIGKTPDFAAAYQHLLRSRDQELAMMGTADPQQRAAVIADEERSVVGRALQDGTSPAEFIYRLAKSRGYQSPAPDAPAARSGKAPVTEQIEVIQRGQAAAKSLSTVGGAAGDTITPEALANMSDDEFRALFDRLSKSKQREMLGG